MGLLKRYLFWTYERGSFHYDVMVTLILLFIFVSPRFINFGDRPKQDADVRGNDILVQASAGGVFVYQVSARGVKQVGAESTHGMSLAQELVSSIQPITGSVVLDRYETLKDASGNVEAYKVYAHRAADLRVQ